MATSQKAFEPADTARQARQPDEKKRPGRIGVVTSRYGPDVLGGAETVLREMAHGLHARGYGVDALTTTAKDLYTYRNVLPESTSDDQGVTVRRFRALPAQRGADPVGHQILSGIPVPASAQLQWMNTGPRSPGLFEYLVDHACDYDALICAPYQSWTTFVCAELAPRQTITIPCLHDEPFARLEIFKGEMEETRGVWFLSEPEMSLARRLFELPEQATVIGSGVIPPLAYDPEGFRSRHGLSGEFLFYAGRREAMKGWTELLDGLSFANDNLPHTLPLVSCGVGSIGSVPANVHVVDLGFVSDGDRSDGFAAASAYVQPSANESFSRTVLEAWLAGTPVIANAHSDVLRWHCERSGAGLTYGDRYEFTEALRLLEESPEMIREIAARGREYVLREFRWDDVLDRVESSLKDWV